MLIEVNTQPPLDKILGGKRVLLELADGLSLVDLLAYLESHYPGFEQGLQTGSDDHGTAFNFFLNRKALREHELAVTSLKNGDRIHILTPIVGGR